MLAQLPGAGQDRNGLRAIIEIIVVQGIDGIEDFPHFPAKILAAEQHQARRLFIAFILRGCSAHYS